MADTPTNEFKPRAQSALARSPIAELQQVQVEELNGRLLISGTVSSFYHKQLAQEVIRTVLRDADVHLVNEIEVCPKGNPAGTELD